MSAAHTAGPWQTARACPQEVGFNAPDRWRTVATCPSVELGIGDQNKALAEARANARLIAAAPTLYAALQSIDSNAAESVEWIRRVARAALAAAEGGAK